MKNVKAFLCSFSVGIIHDDDWKAATLRCWRENRISIATEEEEEKKKNWEQNCFEGNTLVAAAPVGMIRLRLSNIVYRWECMRGR